MRIRIELDTCTDRDAIRNIAAFMSDPRPYPASVAKLWCVGVTRPPLVYTPTGDPGHTYRVEFLDCLALPYPFGLFFPSVCVPYVYSPTAGNSGNSPPQAQWQFQTTGVTSTTPADPGTLLYYQTVTITPPDGSQPIRHRLFITPTATSLTGIGQFNQGAFSEDGNVTVNDDSSGLGIPFPVVYAHKTITDLTIDPTGPTELYLQQPF